LERPLEVPWGSLGATLVAVLLIALLTGGVALRTALRGPLQPMLRGE
jgi:hypothetical protein